MSQQAVVDLIPLSQLRPGESALVGQLVGHTGTVHRLEEMGLRTGVRVQMIQSGSPCIIRLDGNKLCFRATEVLGVLVQGAQGL